MSKVQELNKLAEKITGENPKENTIREILDIISSYFKGSKVKSSNTEKAIKNITENYTSGGGGSNFYLPFVYPDLSKSFTYKWDETLKGYRFSAYDYDPNLDLLWQLMFSPHFTAPFRMIVKQGYQGEEIEMLAQQIFDENTGNYNISAESQDGNYAFDYMCVEDPESGDYIALIANVKGFIVPT